MSVTDPIPKFSRLGLRGEAVVLPVKKAKSSTSIKSTNRSTATTSQSTATRRDSGSMTHTEPNPGAGSNNHPNMTTPDANLKEEGLRKRSSSLGSLKAKIPRIRISDSEHVPPLPPSTNLVSVSNDSASNTPKLTAFPPMVDTPNMRGTGMLRKDSALAAIDEDQPPSPSPDNVESVTRAGNVRSQSQDAQKTRARRKSIKQIVMRITTAPMVAGEKLKFGVFHNTPSNPVVVLPADTLVPLDPPPTTWFRKPASISVQSLPSTKVNLGDAHGGGRFKGIRKRWNAVLETVRR
jgi:hypothetical protein